VFTKDGDIFYTEIKTGKTKPETQKINECKKNNGSYSK